MKPGIFILALIGSACLAVATSLTGGYSFILKILVVSTVYTVLTGYLLRRYKGHRRLIWLLILYLPVILLFVPAHLLHYQQSKHSLPTTMAYPAGFCIGYLASLVRKPLTGLIIALFMLAMINTFAILCYPYWLNKLNYGSYTGKVNEKRARFYAIDENGVAVTEKAFANKYVLLDFWATWCGPCYTAFPVLEKYYIRYKNHPQVAIYAVNDADKRDSVGEAYNTIRKLGYTFPVVVNSVAGVSRRYGVNRYPTIILIDPEGKIIFRGELEGAIQQLDRLIAGKPYRH